MNNGFQEHSHCDLKNLQSEASGNKNKSQVNISIQEMFRWSPAKISVDQKYRAKSFDLKVTVLLTI